MSDADTPIGALLAGPIIAIQEAQIEAEMAAFDFIIDVGLEEQKGGDYRARKLTFQVDRAVSDPQNPGTVDVHQATVTAPLLSLMRIPALKISEAKIDLALNLSEESNSEVESDSETTGRKRFGLKRKAKSMSGKITSRRTTSRSSARQMNISLTVQGAGDDEMYDRLSRLFGESMTALIDTPES